MNRTFLILLMIGTALLIAVIGSDDIDQLDDAMPWNIQILENGSSRIMGITLGKTNIQDAHQIFAHFSETRLVTSNSKTVLLAHFDELNLAGLLAEIDLIYDISETDLEKVRQQAVDTKQGQYQLVRESMLMDLLTTPVKQLIYKPYIDYDNNMISQRFGEPEERESITESTEKLIYPALGLVIYLNTDGPEKFIYSRIDKTTKAEN
ncbi:MAG: hypothetical protein OQK72_02640 [Gammaproteobacteria bacterium]|nr:hypothetical protein [Gammaproteobacteria bacterium]MCW9005748.1 hypothetical protein [Gammaproteobacteria bacterium]MCW9056147.1 hypothetical protein [Gammaproteobacteria bacterium]